MSNLPNPRSYNSILADMINAFLARYGLKGIKLSSPILSILEAAAQSDVRSTQDIFNMLNATSIDRAAGDALLRIAADENVLIQTPKAALGNVTFLDTSFNKISSLIYQGASAPNVGTTLLKVSDASNFPSKGSLYIGRNTANYEGPIAYNSSGSTPPTNNGSYWTITLDTETTKFHNLGESVILAQGGDRSIQSGTLVQTPQGNVSTAIQFSTLYNATIPDGETQLDNVTVIAKTKGAIGNVPAGAITEVVSSPYVGANVTNPLPFTNGLDADTEDAIKEKIKNARQSKSKGTALALVTNVKGASSSVDNKTVVSASVITSDNENPTLIIDDGNGYEETISGVGQETLMDSALGGEQIFQLTSQRPIAKTFVTTNSVAPFNLTDGSQLSVKVGGVSTTHTFSANDFKSISNATAYEIVSSINGNPNLLWNARTANNATQVSLFSRSNTNDDIQVVSLSSGTDANDVLSFPLNRNFTLKLYKNDQLLYKDGQKATLTSNPQNTWLSTITDGDTLQIQVDGTVTQTVTVKNSDFVSSSTGYTTVNSSNSIESWATVLNTLIVGVTVTSDNGVLSLTSNLGNNSKALIKIVGGSLVSKGMFTSNAQANGVNNDYTFNRNTGQLKLTNPLKVGDYLSTASTATNGYLQSGVITSNITLSSTGNLWFAIDGNTSILNTSINSTTSFTLTSPTNTTNKVRYTASNGSFGPQGVTSLTGGYIAPGDWVVIWDPNFTDKGAFRIADVDNASGNWAWFDVERSTVNLQSNINPTNLGIVFARTNKQLENIQISSGTYSLSQLATQINSKLVGGTATVFRNQQLRVGTDSLYDTGDIMLVSADLQGQLLQLPIGKLATCSPANLGIVESSNSELGTPNFQWTTVATVPNSTTFTETTDINFRSGDILTFRKRLNQTSPSLFRRWGNNSNDYMPVSSVSSTTITPRSSIKSSERLVNDRFYAASPFALSPYDTLNLTLDNDLLNKNYTINLFRNVKPNSSATYGSSAFEFLDADNGNVSLTQAFGTSTDLFNDFALHMKSRGKSHSIAANKTILWRFGRYGAEGNYAKISYINPSISNQGFGLTTDNSKGDSEIKLSLPSGNEKTGLNINGNNQFVIAANKAYTVISGKVSRSTNVVTVTVNDNPNVTNGHALSVGDIVYQTTDDTTDGLRAGPKSITAVTNNTFSYNETGANITSTESITYNTSKLPAGTKYTISAISSSGSQITVTIGSHNFNVNDTVYFQPGHFDPTSNITVASGAKTVISVTGTTVTWNEATTSGTATLISGVTYTLSSGQAYKASVYYSKQQIAVGGLSRDSNGLVTATVLNSYITSGHSFKVGDIIYISPGEADFASGAKIVTSTPASNTFTYIEAGSVTTSTAMQYASTTSSDPNFTGGATPVVSGDIVHIDSNTGWSGDLIGNNRITAISSTSFSLLMSDSVYTGFAQPKNLNSTTNISFYPIDTAQSTASGIVSFINANTSLVSATLVPSNGGTTNDGSGVIDKSTQDEFLFSISNASVNGVGQQSVASWSLFDGINWIQTTNLATNTSSQLSLKNTVSGELTSNADFSNENMKLVPTTSKNIVDYLNNTGISGFSSNGSVKATENGKLQIYSNTTGSNGSIQVNGGTGNLASAPIFGSGQSISDGTNNYTQITIPASQINGFTGDSYVSLQGNSKASKTTPWGSSQSMSISNSSNQGEYLITFSPSVNAVNVIQAIVSTGNTVYQIEKQGNFAAYIDNSTSPTALSSSITEGHWVYITSTTLNPANTGFKQIVRVDRTTSTFWIENPDCVEEVTTLANDDFLKFLTYDSVIPGDALVINTNIFGDSNIGSFTVSRLDENVGTTTTNAFYVTGNLSTLSSTALGNNYIYVQIKEQTPIKLIKKIRSINLNKNNSNYYDITFDTDKYYNKISSVVGSTVKALDKLDFPTSLAKGVDGYSYNTGLLAEVNKIIYGDEQNPSVYPGVAAAGTTIDTAGPLVKRISLSIALRLKTGNKEDTINRVKSAVASLINGSVAGISIPIGKIVGVVNDIDGVMSSSMISPTYNSTNDLILIQANEKPKILDIDQDISISIIGT